MANRVVWASAALGVTAYVANERYKDYQCVLEAQQEEERKRDAMERAEEQRKEAMERQFRQQRRKNKKTQEEGGFPSVTDDFGRFVQFYNMENRYTWTIFLNRLRDNAMALYGRNKNKLGLDLPLLEDQRNTPDEITFAAALALGDPQIMEMIIQEQNLVHMTPDLVLANITSTALYLIWREFEEYYASIKAFPTSKTPLRNMNKDLIDIAFALISSHQTLVFPVNEKLERGHLEELQQWASKLGFHLLSSDGFSERSEGNVRYFTINYAQNSLKPGRKYYMMNFKGNFYVQLQDAGPGLQTMRFGVVHTRAKVELLIPTERHNKARVQFVAQLASMGMARVAARNIGLFGGSSASVEHICVQSGMTVGVLQGWRGGFLQMLDTNKASIVNRLKGRLEQCIPPPQKDSDVSIVKAEVSTFVDQYSRLLDLSYSVVPLLHKKPPSRWVPDKSVQEEAMEGIFSSLRAEQIRTKRFLEQDERERLVRSRKNMMPSPFVTASTTGALLATFYWSSFCALHAFVRGTKLQSYVQLYFPVLPNYTTSMLVHVASMCFAANMLLNGCRLLQKPLSVSGAADDDVFSMIWATTASLCEVISRQWTVLKTHRTPFEHELTRLKLLCQSKYQIWKDRCARQDFDDAIKRKRISPDVLVYLLEYYRKDGARNAKKEEVRIPGSKTDLDAFLEVKVIERDDDENVNGDETADEMKSKIMALSELAEESNEKLSNLAVGTRVDVDLEASVGFDNGLRVPPAESSVLAAKRFTRGSVVASFGEVVLILLDGESQPSAIPLKLCTVVQDTEEAEEEPTSPRTKFTFGDTVLVQIESDRRDDEKRINHVGATGRGDGGDENFQSAVGTVVQTYGENVLVLLDDDDEPVMVLAEQCSCIPRLKSPMEEEEPKSESDKPESDFERATTVEDAIRQGGWTLKRRKNHLVLERPMRDNTGGTQMATLPKTPSDRRAYRNALALLNRLNRESYASPSDTPGKEVVRECMLCRETKVESDFSKSQWKKQTGGVKCKACLGHPE